MSRTIAEIRDLAAGHLGLLGVGQVLSAEHSADLVNAYHEVHSQYEAEGLATWSSTANIPDQYASPMSYLTAEKRIVKYKMPAERELALLREVEKARIIILSLRARPKMGVTVMQNF